MSTPTSEVTDTWDVIVIGGGAAGENAAQYAIQGSDRTAVIVEAELIGGECSYWACMPSKALLRPIEVLDSGQVGWASEAGIEVVRGRARLAGEKLVEVTALGGATRTLHARHAVVLATGSTASIPPIEGLREASPWTSRDVTNLREVPGRVAVDEIVVAAGRTPSSGWSGSAWTRTPTATSTPMIVWRCPAPITGCTRSGCFLPRGSA